MKDCSFPSQVAKERLAVFKPTKLEKPASEDLDNIDYLTYLLAEREQILFKQLGGKVLFQYYWPPSNPVGFFSVLRIFYSMDESSGFHNNKNNN